MVTVSRPEYVTVLTQNTPGRLEPGTRRLILDRRMEPASDIVARVADKSSEDSYNWVIAEDGKVFELAGWDRATWGHKDAYVICVAGEDSDAQHWSLVWLLEQLGRKRSTPRLL